VATGELKAKVVIVVIDESAVESSDANYPTLTSTNSHLPIATSIRFPSPEDHFANEAVTVLSPYTSESSHTITPAAVSDPGAAQPQRGWNSSRYVLISHMLRTRRQSRMTPSIAQS
jgi:hypothetical protein